MRPMRLSGALLLALAATAGCQQVGRAAPARPPDGEAWLSAEQLARAQVRTALVADQDVDAAVETSGRVTFDDQRVAHVFSPVSGRVVAIAAQPGQRVARGALLALIDSPDVGAAAAELARAEAEQTAAAHDYHRQRELAEAHAASQKDYEAALGSYEKANAERMRAQKKATLLRRGGHADAVTQQYRLTAPIDGEVVMRAISPGMEVAGQYGQGNAVELFAIGAADRVWVIGDLFQVDIGRVQRGAHVTVRAVARPTRSFEGVVDWISEQLDPNTHTARVRCVIENSDRALAPEMFATLAISVAPSRVLAIPRAALVRLGDQTVAFVAVGATPGGASRFERRPIAVDESGGGDYLPITSGLARGERVVTDGARELAALM